MWTYIVWSRHALFVMGLATLRCRTGWSALYDDSEEEEATPRALHAEPSHASSLSFQPHNLFKEHFATAAPAPSPRHATDPPGTLAAQPPSTNNASHSSRLGGQQQQQQQEDPGAASLHSGGAYPCKIRRGWGSHTDGAVVREQCCGDEPGASSQRGASQSPKGKPPLPTAHRFSAKGANSISIWEGAQVFAVYQLIAVMR